jgi:hypothetical protein
MPDLSEIQELEHGRRTGGRRVETTTVHMLTRYLKKTENLVRHTLMPNFVFLVWKMRGELCETDSGLASTTSFLPIFDLVKPTIAAENYASLLLVPKGD